MVSWVTAFKTALKIILMSLGWYILGIIIIIAGWAGGGLAALSNPNPSSILGGIGGAVIASIVGGAIIYLGVMATTLKYSVELIADEVRAKGAVPSFAATAPPPPYPPPVLTEKICSKCGVQNVFTAQYCTKCGNKL